MIFTFTTLCLSKQTLQRQVWALTPLPALIHSAPVRYIVYVIWSGFNIIYYLLFLSPYYYTVSPSEVGTPMPLSPGQHIVPLTCDNVIFTRDGSQVWAGDNHSPLQRHIDLLFCQVYFSISPPLLSWSQLPIAPSAVTGERGILPEWGANIFCRDSFNPLLGILLVVSHSLTAAPHPKNSYKDQTLTSKCCQWQLIVAGSSWQVLTAPWVSLGHCSWRERQRLPAAARGLDE